MNIGEMTGVSSVTFSSDKGGAGALYVVTNGETDFFKFREQHGHDAKKADGINLDGSEARFFLVFVEDCFDPCVCIVRADNGSEAEEKFTDVKDWADVSEADRADYSEDKLQWSGRNTWFDSEGIVVREVFPLSIQF